MNKTLIKKIDLFLKLAESNEIYYRVQPKGTDLFNHTSGLGYEKVNGIFAFEDIRDLFNTYSWLHMKKDIDNYEVISFFGDLIDKPINSEGVVVKPEIILNKMPLKKLEKQLLNQTS